MNKYENWSGITRRTEFELGVLGVAVGGTLDPQRLGGLAIERFALACKLRELGDVACLLPRALRPAPETHCTRKD
jgi:hypothetical protein